ncbi:hypothetical protein CCAX7_46130 [Capsulimonas corticalis]|uniref:Uncharacterized protein n=1 Tax=Capsulimonas corticalis TaxID=2219043 RepID=A0A402D596_9BACT|nr:recombinase family protein [Capsulimonas corticalis]BDI32562.1 hypothetical protein CCAX7_46130 [Capsulimonas corticalis]
MTINKTRGAVLYTRVSSDGQEAHGTSPETQLDACRLKALDLGLPIVAEYYDGGISGAWLTQRHGMMQAIADIQAGRADTLICANMSRYSRDTEHQQVIKKAVQAAGGRIIFCDMNFDDTPEGDFAFGMMGQFAEYERKVIRKRTYSGFVKRAEHGIQSARRTSPFGYRIVTKADVLRGHYTHDQLGKYQIIESQAQIVRDLFAKYVAGTHSLNELAKELNSAGAPTPGGGKCWRSTNIRFMFLNPVYKGCAVFGRFDHDTDESRLGQVHQRTGKPLTSAHRMRPAAEDTWITFDCPALVSEDVWDYCAQQMQENKKLKSGNPNRVHMLTARVFCRECGAGMYHMSPTRQKSKKPGSTDVFEYPARYQCGVYRTSVVNLGKGNAACAPTGYYVQDIEERVISALEDACLRPAMVAALVAEYNQMSPATLDGDAIRRQLTALDRALKEIGQEEAAAVQAQIAGIRAGASPDVYQAVFAEIAARRQDLEKQRGVLAKSVNVHPSRGRAMSPKPVAITDILADVRIALTSPHVPGATKRDITGSVIEKVLPFKEGKNNGAEIFFKPGLFADETFADTVGTPSAVPEMSLFLAGNRQGSGRVPSGNSETTAPPEVTMLSKRVRFSDG